MTRRRPLLALLLAGVTALSAAVVSAPSAPAAGADTPPLAWSLLATGSAERFRGLSAVDDQVAWVSGTNGTVLRTIDGGVTWASVGPRLAGANAAFQFRDVEAFSATTAVILSIGTGTDSRIYRTQDGGATWSLSFVNHEATAFYDCLAFTTPNRGVASSDPVDGRFRLVETVDGGRTWTRVATVGMPPALDGEAGFAASGTCLSAGQGQRVYLATGGAMARARVLRSDDGGRVWQAADTTVRGAPTAGVFSVQFRDARHGIAVGGNFRKPEVTAHAASWSDDGGATWQQPTTATGGYRSGSSWVPGAGAEALAVGPTGSDVTTDGGRTWQTFDTGSFDSVQCTSGSVCWASGELGRVARLTVPAAVSARR
ncbi:oxidoreductase [Dermatophilaceae bacterium Soc4.6]